VIYRWLLAILIFPVTVHATVYWDDELEAGNTGYTLPSEGMAFDTGRKFSGTGSVRLDYPSECYPDQNPVFQCGGFMDRSHTATGHLFVRVYIWLPSTFTTGDTETKTWTILPTGSTTYDVVWAFKNGDRNLSVSAVRAIDGVEEVHTSTGDVPADQWVCIQLEHQLNTIGSANGIFRAWVNGTQVLNHTNVTMLVSGDSNGHNFETMRLFRQVGLGSLWYDRLAVGDASIPCVGGGGGGGTTAGGGLDF